MVKKKSKQKYVKKAHSIQDPRERRIERNIIPVNLGEKNLHIWGGVLGIVLLVVLMGLGNNSSQITGAVIGLEGTGLQLLGAFGLLGVVGLLFTFLYVFNKK